MNSQSKLIIGIIVGIVVLCIATIACGAIFVLPKLTGDAIPVQDPELKPTEMAQPGRVDPTKTSPSGNGTNDDQPARPEPTKPNRDNQTVPTTEGQQQGSTTNTNPNPDKDGFYNRRIDGPGLATGPESKLPLTFGREYRFYEFINIPMEVKNETGVWIGGLKVEITLYDADGNALAQEDVRPFTGEVAPGDTVAFMFLRDEGRLDGKYSYFVFNRISAYEVDTPASKPELNDLKVEQDGNWYTITGEFINNGTDVCHNPQVVVVGYDADGYVYNVETSSIQNNGEYMPDAPAGKSFPFDTLVDNDEQKITKLTVKGSCDSY